jgi:hypothetical protein
MSNLIVTEYDGVVQSAGDAAVQVPGNIVASQAIAIGAGSAQSAAFNARTRFVLMFAEAKCCVAFGSSPTATATAQLAIGAEQIAYQSVTPGHKLAVIQR